MTTLTPPLDQRATRASLLQGWPARAALAAGVALAVGVVAVGPARLIAQIEGDRGIAPVVVTNDIEVNGVEVEATGKTAAVCEVPSTAVKVPDSSPVSVALATLADPLAVAFVQRRFLGPVCADARRQCASACCSMNALTTPTSALITVNRLGRDSRSASAGGSAGARPSAS